MKKGLKNLKSNLRLEFLFNNNLLNSKRSQSEIVSSVLLILLVVIAAMLILAFVIPFVREKLASGDCLDVAGKVEISSGYTCYNGTAMQIQVHVLEIRDLIDGFSIELGGASTNNFKIINDTIISGVSMCDGSQTPEVPPADNTERTYVIIANEPNVIRVYPILKGGKTCGASDTITIIEGCSPSQRCP